MFHGYPHDILAMGPLNNPICNLCLSAPPAPNLELPNGMQVLHGVLGGQHLQREVEHQIYIY